MQTIQRDVSAPQEVSVPSTPALHLLSEVTNLMSIFPELLLHTHTHTIYIIYNKYRILLYIP